MSFAAATAVEQLDATTWRAEVMPTWDIMGNANGGYLLAIAARAALAACGRADPVTVTGHFLAPAAPGPVTVRTEVLKQGRQLATVVATLHRADGRPLLGTIGSFGDLTGPAPPERVEASPPDLPPVEECLRVEPTATFPPPFTAHVDMRLHPEDVPFGPAGPQGRPRVRGWFRWPDGEPMDTLGLLVATDAFPPTSFSAALPVAWTPTIELTTHVRERPQPGEWLRCAFSTRFITPGFLEEDGELWDGRGRLIAQSRQLALVPRG